MDKRQTIPWVVSAKTIGQTVEWWDASPRKFSKLNVKWLDNNHLLYVILIYLLRNWWEILTEIFLIGKNAIIGQVNKAFLKLDLQVCYLFQFH